MLEGGTDASNTDPYAKAPTEGNMDRNRAAPDGRGFAGFAKGHPSSPTPNTKAPYVMWAARPTPT